MSDSWSPVFNIIEKKNSRFDEADLQTIREHASSLSGYAGNRANVLNGRLAVELLDVNTCLIDAVTKLDASSTRLVSTTNRLTTANPLADGSHRRLSRCAGRDRSIYLVEDRLKCGGPRITSGPHLFLRPGSATSHLRCDGSAVPGCILDPAMSRVCGLLFTEERKNAKYKISPNKPNPRIGQCSDESHYRAEGPQL